MEKAKQKIFTVQFMTRVAIFGAIAAILYCVPFLKFQLPFFLSFLEMHFDEIPAFIAGFAYGPLYGEMVLIIKTIIKLPMSSTYFIGEFLDLLYGSALIIPAAMFYKNHRTFKGAMIGIILGLTAYLLTTTICAGLFVLDLYCFVLGYDSNIILSMGQALAPEVTNIHWPMAFYCFLPFNAFKGVIVVAITILLYPHIRYFTEKRWRN